MPLSARVTALDPLAAVRLALRTGRNGSPAVLGAICRIETSAGGSIGQKSAICGRSPALSRGHLSVHCASVNGPTFKGYSEAD
jgi:hypothetical protein